MKKEIFISILKKIEIIFSYIKVSRDNYKFIKQKNYLPLIDFLNSFNDKNVYTWAQCYIEPGTFFAMNIKLSTANVENKSMIVIFNEDDTVTIKPDLNCSLQIEPYTDRFEDAFEMLSNLICMYMHPELKKDEIYFADTIEGFPFIPKGTYKTLRIGNNVLDSNGNKIEGKYPVFISQKEFNVLLKEIEEEEKMIEDYFTDLLKNM